jgi:hypothetical protein
MDTSLLVWWLIAGWCGTRPRRPKVPPPPLPQVLILIAAGLIGGLLGGWLFTAVWPVAEVSAGAIYAAVSGLPAFAGGRVVSDILGFWIRALGPQPIPPGYE